jgi:sugar lactone lactonase YvrE
MLAALTLIPNSVNAEVIVHTLAGNGIGTFADGTRAAFFNPSGVAVDDTSGNVFVADYSNHRIRQVTPAGVVSTLTGNGTPSFAEGVGVAASFKNPNGVAIDASKNLIIADMSNNRIRFVTPGGVVTTLAGNGSATFVDGPSTSACFKNPRGVAVDSSGNVFVADFGNHRIRRIARSGVVSTLAGSGLAAFADGIGTGAAFNNLFGVALDKSDNMFVTDQSNHRVRKVTPDGLVSTLAGSGSAAFADGTGAGASFRLPAGVAMDSSGNVVVADHMNHRIRKITPHGVVVTLAGNGSGMFSDGNGVNSSFYFPTGVAIDSGDNIIIADTTNHRIRVIVYLLPPTLSMSGNTTRSSTISVFTTGTWSPIYSLSGSASASSTGSSTSSATGSSSTSSALTISATISATATRSSSGSLKGLLSAALTAAPMATSISSASSIMPSHSSENLISLSTTFINHATISCTPTILLVFVDPTINLNETTTSLSTSNLITIAFFIAVLFCCIVYFFRFRCCCRRVRQTHPAASSEEVSGRVNLHEPPTLFSHPAASPEEVSGKDNLHEPPTLFSGNS